MDSRNKWAKKSTQVNSTARFTEYDGIVIRSQMSNFAFLFALVFQVSCKPQYTCTTYQCHVIHPSSMVLLKVVYLGDVINDTDNISSVELLHLYNSNT